MNLDLRAYLVDCEGAGSNGHRGGGMWVGCPMCGRWFDVTRAGMVTGVPEHRRIDDLRLIDDGAFDGLDYADGLALAEEGQRMLDADGWHYPEDVVS